MASNEAARSTGPLAPLPRRQMPAGHRVLSPHQAEVLNAATGCLTAEPPRRAVDYIDQLLSQFDSDTRARRVRVADLRDQYSNGVALLDQLAGGDFAALPRLQQGLILSHAQVVPFASVLFDHIVDAIYAPPEVLRRNAANRYHETG